MYYRSVNRGLSFTKSGRYAVGFVLILGFFATGSGYNGLYLALSLGLSLLVVSGLLSEKVMKFCGPTTITPLTVDSDTPFAASLRVSNLSPTFSGYGLQYVVLETSPQFKLLSAITRPLMEGNILKLGASTTTEVQTWCNGLRRGVHREFTVVQRTGYPFGLLIKYKFSPVLTNIRVLPKFDEQLAEKLRNELRGSLARRTSDQEFYSHRLYVSGDALRFIDWKKSSRVPSQWVIKLYESNSESREVLVAADESQIRNSPDEKSYESWLVVIRTTAQVIEEFSKVPALTLDGKTYFIGLSDTLPFLVDAPTFEKRAQFSGQGPRRSIGLDARGRLNLNAQGFSWEDEWGHKYG
jgi:uncharacterized protein (DUF58 family)